MATNLVESCQPELAENADSLVTVGYDRQRNTAVYVDTLSVEMKKKKKFQSLLAPGCNSRRDVTLAIQIRREGSEEWEDLATDIKITARNYDDYKELDPCSRYQVRIVIKPRSGSEERALPIFTVGPFQELDTEEMKITKFKGDGEQYYADHFKAEYVDVTDKSFTIRWEPICALGINVFVKDWEDEDWEEEPKKRISNDINNPTTQLTFDVTPCKAYEVVFEFFIDSEEQEIFDTELPNVKIAIEKKDLKQKFSKYSLDKKSQKIKWNYTGLLDELECVESFSYRLLKEEKGDIEQLFVGDDQDRKENEFDIQSIQSECSVGLKMEVEFVFLEDNHDTIHAFEEFFQNKDEKDNSIQLNDSSILYEISPCIPSGSELFFAVTEVVEEEEEMDGILPETRLMGMVSVDESSYLPLSQFEELDLKSCAAYNMKLLRKIEDNYKELESIEFRNPKWKIWETPSLHSEEVSETSITLKITDHETDGNCPVSHYDIRCYDTGATSDASPTIFDTLKLTNLSPGTRYNCTGRIVHNISGISTLKSPWTGYHLLETNAGVETGSISQSLEMTPEANSGTGVVPTKTFVLILFLLYLY